MRTAAALLCCLLLSTGCEDRVRPAVTAVPAADPPAQESWNSTVTFSDSGRVKAVLWSGHISVYTVREMTLFEDSVHVDFYSERGDRTSTLTARRGRLDDRTRDFEAWENVVVVSDSGRVLRTERLFWTNATRMIHTDADVHIITPTEEIRGTGMESDQGLRNYRIFRVSGQAVTKD